MLRYVAASFLAGPFFWCVLGMVILRITEKPKTSTVAFGLSASLIFSIGLLITYLIFLGFSVE